jgi:putative ABC transport system permease protein
VPQYRRGASYGFSQGRAFAPNKFEAVIGSEVAADLGLGVGSEFHATHGFPGPNDVPDVHEEVWKVVGILKETHTANDRVLFIPLLTFYAIFEHEAGLEAIGTIQNGGSKPATAPAPLPPPAPASEPEKKAYTMNEKGEITVKLPKEEWEVSAILVQTQSPYASIQMQFLLRNLPEAVGVSPAVVMQQFFETFLPRITLLLLIISGLVTVVAGVSILVSIYNSVTARNREIAIMRALGATKERILAAVCLEAGLVGAMGGVLGLFAGHLLAAGGSVFLSRIMGTGIAWWSASRGELIYLGGVIMVSLLAGLVPAMKAYRVPVAENLVGS